MTDSGTRQRYLSYYDSLNAWLDHTPRMGRAYARFMNYGYARPARGRAGRLALMKAAGRHGRLLGSLITESYVAPDDDVLEVGAGRLGNAALVSRLLGPRVVAVDLAVGPMRTQLARSAVVVRVAADVHRLPIANGCFDVVLCVESQHSYSDPGEFLAECARVLRSGGRLLVWDFVSELTEVTLLRSAEDAGFSLTALHDRTDRVLRSRAKAFTAGAFMPRGHLEGIEAFACLPGSELYEMMKDGTVSYREYAFELRRPTKQAITQTDILQAMGM